MPKSGNARDLLLKSQVKSANWGVQAFTAGFRKASNAVSTSSNGSLSICRGNTISVSDFTCANVRCHAGRAIAGMGRAATLTGSDNVSNMVVSFRSSASAIFSHTIRPTPSRSRPSSDMRRIIRRQLISGQLMTTNTVMHADMPDRMMRFKNNPARPSTQATPTGSQILKPARSAL